MKNNIQKIVFVTILTTLFFSSCSTYQKFSERKYYNFPYTKHEGGLHQKQNAIEKSNASIVIETLTDAINKDKNLANETLLTASLQKNNLPVSGIHFNHISADSKTHGALTFKSGLKSSIKKIKNEKAELAASKKGAGFALLFSGVGAFVIGIVFLLVISALFGALLMIAGVALIVVGIILLVSSSKE